MSRPRAAASPRNIWPPGSSRRAGPRAAEEALHYVAPVGEKALYVERALDAVRPFLTPGPATGPEAPAVQAAALYRRVLSARIAAFSAPAPPRNSPTASRTLCQPPLSPSIATIPPTPMPGPPGHIANEPCR